VRRLLVFVLLAVFAAISATPAVARHHQNPKPTKAQKQAQKDWEKYNRQQAKAQNKQLKAQNKAIKKYNKEHGTRTTTW
jgi:hypothetical protein